MSHSLRKAINGFCKVCIYDPYAQAGSWRQQVTDCTDKKCYLYPVRPISETEKLRRQQGGEIGEEAPYKPAQKVDIPSSKEFLATTHCDGEPNNEDTVS